MAEEKHVARLKEGVEAWNAWRRDGSCARPDLRGADLQHSDLVGADLSAADLCQANLRGADLSYASLIKAQLTGADLRGAHLRGARLCGADLRRANLGEVDLSYADLLGADLGGADLRGADRCPSAPPFQSPAWLLPWWRVFQPGELLIVTVRQDDRLALAWGASISRTAHVAGDSAARYGASDYLDVLIDPQASDEVVTALVDHVTAHADRWDSWELEELAPDAAAWALPRAMDLIETMDRKAPVRF